MVEIRGQEVGIVGTKGFVGGFEGAELPDFGEPLLRAVYAETTEEVEAIERGLEAIAGCHPPDRAAPLRPRWLDTLEGEPQTIWAFLGSRRLAGADRRAPPRPRPPRPRPPRQRRRAAIGEVPVRNVAIHVTGQDFTRFEL